MPSWKIHLKVANNIKEKLNIYEDKDKFMLGNVLPDIYSGHIIKNVSKIVEYEISHYRSQIIINGGKFFLPDYDMFKNIHMEVLNDSLILGYLTHLITDNFFNKYTYTNCCLIDDKGEVCGIKTKKNEVLNCNRKTMSRMKQEDFAAFDKMIKLDKCNFSYTSDIFDSLKKLQTFNVEKEDMLKVINYLNTLTFTQDNNKTSPLILFSKETLDKMIEACSDFILGYINRI